MKNKLKKMAAGVLLLASMQSNAQVQQIVDMSTGINSSNALIAIGLNDDTWQVKTPAGSAFSPVKCAGQTFNGNQFYNPVITNVRLLSPFTDNSSNIALADSDLYVYKMTFNHTSCIKSSMSMYFTTIGADNYIKSIKLNNYIVFSGGPGTLAQDIICNPWSSGKSFNNIPVTALSQGTNTIQIEVINQSGRALVNGKRTATLTPTGLLIDGKLTINYIPNSGLNPVITTTKSNFCTYDQFAFNGTAAPGSITNSYWELAETDDQGNYITGGYSYSQWVTGNPGNFTFSNPPACGKYYKIKLAVLNQCVNWEETNKVIYYSCGPNVNAGTDQNICTGQCVKIGSLQNILMYSFLWSNRATTPQQTVCPSVSTTYVLTQTDVTGCSKSDQVVVNVYTNNPDFTRNTHANPMDNFYTVDCTPVDLTANTVAGFGHVWTVEEVIQTGINPNTYSGVSGTNSGQGTNPNPCCWWPLATNYFGGYTGTANVNCTSPPNCIASPAIGNFPLGKLYRITRGTWNNFCVWNQKAYVVSQSGPLRLANGQTQGLTWVEDINAPDISYLKNSVNPDQEIQTISIMPNPTSSMVKIQSIESIKSITVISINGALLIENANEKEIDLSSLPSGMYFFNIVTENARKTIKVIKE
jgi:hypothetical protein